ncbi:MAG TPA: hypothetical protein VF316_02895 [Polyangiaceae bacterium]
MGSLAACGGVTTADVKDAATPDVVAPDATPPNDASPAPSDTSTFAIQKIYLGESPRGGGAASNQAWKKFGYNLDGKITLAQSNDVCTRAPGAPSSNQVDGDLGIDNAFGAVILPIIQSAASLNEPSTTASAQFQTGKGTYQLSIKGLGADSSQTATGLSGGVFRSLDYRGDSVVAVPFPGFGPATDWPVRVEGLADGLTIAGGPKLVFGKADVSNGTFGGSGLDFPVSISFSGLDVTLLIHHALVTFDHTAPGTAANGTIAGVLDTEEFVLELKKAAGYISPVLCGTQFDGVAQQIRQAADIMVDLSNVAGISCNAISIGLGFDATLVANPTKIAKAPLPVLPNPCP